MGLFSFFARVLGCQMWIFTMLGAGCFYISISVLGACSEMQVVLLGDGFFPLSIALKKLGAHSKRWQFLLLKIDFFIMLSLIPVTSKQWGVFVEARSAPGPFGWDLLHCCVFAPTRAEHCFMVQTSFQISAVSSLFCCSVLQLPWSPRHSASFPKLIAFARHLSSFIGHLRVGQLQFLPQLFPLSGDHGLLLSSFQCFENYLSCLKIQLYHSWAYSQKMYTHTTRAFA